jgi:hypothetical protein
VYTNNGTESNYVCAARDPSPEESRMSPSEFVSDSNLRRDRLRRYMREDQEKILQRYLLTAQRNATVSRTLDSRGQIVGQEAVEMGERVQRRVAERTGLTSR